MQWQSWLQSERQKDNMRYLLDTTALLSHYRKELGWEAVQSYFEDSNAELLLAAPSLTEFGRRLRELKADEKTIEEVLASYQLLFSEVVAIDTTVASAALRIGWQAKHRLPLVDALIAACAQVRNATLIHRDEHMRGIPTDLIQQVDLGE